MLMLSFAVSCRQEVPEATRIELSADQVTLTKTGKSSNEGSAAVIVKSNVYWRAFVQENCDWLTLSRAGGPDGETELLITAESNFDGDRREAKVVFEAFDGFTAQLRIVQNGAEDAINVIADDFGASKDSDVVFTHGVGTATGLSYATFVYDGTGCSISSKNPSSGYTDASGEANLLLLAGAEMTLCKLDYHLGLQYTLSFGLWAENSDALRSLSIMTSTDSDEWTPLAFATDFSASGWRTAYTRFDFEKTVQQGWIRFMNNSDADIRIDDILMVEDSFGVDSYASMTITGREWADGDRVTVFDEMFQHEFKYSGAAFRTIMPVNGNTVALYPADPSAYVEDGAIHTTIPASYTYDPASEAPVAVMLGKGTSSAVALKPVTGAIKVKLLKTKASLTSVKVDVMEGDPLAGECDIDIDTFEPVFDEDAEGTVVVLLSSPMDMSTGDGNTVLVPVPVGTYESLQLTATDTQGNETGVELSDVTIKSGENYEVSLKCEDASVVNMNMPSYYGETGTDKVYSNCYRVSEPGSYKFECKKPDGTLVQGADGTWIWATTGIWTSKDSADYEDIVSDLSWDGKYFYFTVEEDSTPGNVFVAVVDDDGNILYSWHIWTTDEPEDISLGGFMWMDRNLGASYSFDPTDRAICQAARGFYYSWGSRVAVIGTYDWNSTAAFVEGSSATFYCYNEQVKNTGAWSVLSAFPEGWGATCDEVASYPMSTIGDNTRFCNIASSATWAAINDPCPYGYHVMTFAEASEIGKVTVETIKEEEGTLVNVASKFNDLILPSCGYLNNATGALKYAANPDGRYWTSETLSTDVTKGRYWLMNLSNNKTNQAGKSVCMSVRCVRNHE